MFGGHRIAWRQLPVPAEHLEAFRQVRDHTLSRLLSASEPISLPGSVPAQ